MTDTHCIDIDPATVVVACFPGSPFNMGSIWARRFVGVKVGDNADGSIRVQVYGSAPDLKQSVFRRGAAVIERGA